MNAKTSVHIGQRHYDEDGFVARKFHCLKAALLTLVGTVPASAQNNETVWQSFLEANSFRPVVEATSTFELGGLVVPGQERLGTVLTNYARQAFNLTTDPQGGVLKPSTPLTADSQLANALVERQPLHPSCPSPKFIIDRVTIRQLVVPRTQRLPSERLADLAKMASVPAAALRPYVVVTAIATPHVVVTDCADRATTKALTKRGDSIVVGYRAGVIADANEGVGSQAVVKILQLFELGDLTKQPDRNIQINGIETQPSGVRIGWASLVQLGDTPAIGAADDRFRWLGDTPIGPYTLWAGTFFFRIKKDDGKTDTQQIDLSVPDAGRTIKLHFPN
jgi:hypothetical protein